MCRLFSFLKCEAARLVKQKIKRLLSNRFLKVNTAIGMEIADVTLTTNAYLNRLN